MATETTKTYDISYTIHETPDGMYYVIGSFKGRDIETEKYPIEQQAVLRWTVLLKRTIQRHGI